MRIKTLLGVLLAFSTIPALGAVTFGSSNGAYTTGTTCGSGFSITPTAGNDLVAVIETFTASPTFSSVASTVGATVITDVAFPASGTGIEYAAYRVHGATAVSQGITVTFTAATECYAWFYNISPASFDQATGVATGTSGSFLTSSLTPAQNGSLLIAVAGLTTSKTLSAWTNSFTAAAQDRTTGPTAYSAYLAQATAASVNAGATVSASATWYGLLLDYVPSASVCTHSGITSAGALATPNGTSGSYWLKSGSFGAPDCSTVLYWPPTLGNWTLN
jgi:hypothetical protein